MIDRSRRALLPSDFPLKVIQQDMALIWKKGRKWWGAQKLKNIRGGLKRLAFPPPPPTLANMYKGEQRGLCTNILASKHLKDQRRTILGHFWDLQNYFRLEQKF